ncbi:3-hydroxyacyl-CoA dehydrogenase family protein [Thalassococcus sp. S3]|uniref:3-hydroxyacyl-CoA dehydrogenase family protein n=1 Tax=Thalassococcus sp. S3 TaxID=2017482 RepID=UPI001023F6CA|nr:3-hydroxyacyl-CoA dehydrogenase family protein [Thalassococcus sp. S3]QBF33861.1 hypothetical protein CFI11_21985 [Thalassococcus sp. S3]
MTRIAVLGASTTGVALAQACRAAGYDIALIEPDAGAAERAAHFLGKTASPLTVDTSTGALATADLILETLDEAEERAALYAEMPRNTVVASTRADGLADLATDPTCALGLTVFTPMHLRSLTEIMPLAETGAAAQEALSTLLHRLGRVAVVIPPGHPSIGLRLLDRFQEAADTLLMDGAILWEIDEAMVAFGFDLGLYEAQDLAGLDTAYARRKATPRDPARRYIPIADRAVQEGRLGQKIGWGWYRYPGGGGAVIDPLIEDLVREEAWFAKAPQREFEADEIQRRLTLALINEASAILGDTPGMDAPMMDRISVTGLGFPKVKGGVLSYADTLGVAKVLPALQELSEEDPIAWAPAPLILQAAQSGSRLSEIGR